MEVGNVILGKLGVIVNRRGWNANVLQEPLAGKDSRYTYMIIQKPDGSYRIRYLIATSSSLILHGELNTVFNSYPHINIIWDKVYVSIKLSDDEASKYEWYLLNPDVTATLLTDDPRYQYIPADSNYTPITRIFTSTNSYVYFLVTNGRHVKVASYGEAGFSIVPIQGPHLSVAKVDSSSVIIQMQGHNPHYVLLSDSGTQTTIMSVTRRFMITNGGFYYLDHADVYYKRYNGTTTKVQGIIRLQDDRDSIKKTVRQFSATSPDSEYFWQYNGEAFRVYKLRDGKVVDELNLDHITHDKTYASEWYIGTWRRIAVYDNKDIHQRSGRYTNDRSQLADMEFSFQDQEE